MLPKTELEAALVKDFVQFVLTDGSRIARFSGTACPLLVDAVTLPLRKGGGLLLFLFTDIQ